MMSRSQLRRWQVTGLLLVIITLNIYNPLSGPLLRQMKHISNLYFFFFKNQQHKNTPPCNVEVISRTRINRVYYIWWCFHTTHCSNIPGLLDDIQRSIWWKREAVCVCVCGTGHVCLLMTCVTGRILIGWICTVVWFVFCVAGLRFYNHRSWL